MVKSWEYEPEFLLIGLHNKTGTLQWTDGSPYDYNNFAPGALAHPIDCVKMNLFTALWHNSDCTSGGGIQQTVFVCRKKATEIPQTYKFDCPSESKIYNDTGTLWSPGYPENYMTSYFDPLRCKYHIQGKDGYKVILEVDKVALGTGDNIEVYEGWEAIYYNKLATIEKESMGLSFSTKSENKMLVVFNGETEGIWRLGFYTEPVNPPTQDPSITTVPPSLSPHCPSENVFGDDVQIESPLFPFAYPTNTNCIYYLPLEKPYTHMIISVLELNIGSDDYIDFIDQSSNYIFASTKTNVVEPYELVAPFPVAINFRSGNVAEMFGQWRIAVERAR